MGRFCVVIVSYVLFGFTSCAPVGDPVTLLLKEVCPKAKNIFPPACRQETVPPECEIVVDYVTRLCKRDEFEFEPKPVSNITCPLSLPAIEHQGLIKNETRSVMERLTNKTSCEKECSGNGAEMCSRLIDLAMLINTPPKTEESIPKPVIESKPVVVKTDATKPREESKVERKPDTPVLSQSPQSVDPPPKKDVSAAPDVIKPVPQIPENPPVEDEPNPIDGDKPDLDRPVDADDTDPEPGLNMAGSPRQEDYGEDDSETEIKPSKPANKIIEELPEASRPFHEGPFQEAPDSHFFVYFLFFTSISVIGYIAFHNKNKLLALALEGRRGRQGRRRPNSASYRKLDNSLEEAIMSNPSRSSNSPVIF